MACRRGCIPPSMKQIAGNLSHTISQLNPWSPIKSHGCRKAAFAMRLWVRCYWGEGECPCFWNVWHKFWQNKKITTLTINHITLIEQKINLSCHIIPFLDEFGDFKKQTHGMTRKKTKKHANFLSIFSINLSFHRWRMTGSLQCRCGTPCTTGTMGSKSRWFHGGATCIAPV